MSPFLGIKVEGISSSIFVVNVPKPGVYPLRLVWFEGGGGANVEWFSLTACSTCRVMRGATMSFMIPAKLKTEEVPKPSGGPLTVREFAAGRFAVLRFSGGRDATKEAESLAQLKTWMNTEKLSVLSSPVYAYFDPPWTPPFLRRNEVMLQTKAEN